MTAVVWFFLIVLPFLQQQLFIKQKVIDHHEDKKPKSNAGIKKCKYIAVISLDLTLS